MSRILNSIAGHSTTYEKFVMDKYTKAKNMQKIFIGGFPIFQIPYFSKKLIIDKEELIIDKENDILSPRLRDFFSKNQ